MSQTPPSTTAVLYSRPDCPLCFALRRVAARAARRAGIPLRVTDVSLDPDLLARYGSEVPVLELPGGRTLGARATDAEVNAAFQEALNLRRRP
jgi:glutaredoxin